MRIVTACPDPAGSADPAVWAANLGKLGEAAVAPFRASLPAHRSPVEGGRRRGRPLPIGRSSGPPCHRGRAADVSTLSVASSRLRLGRNGGAIALDAAIPGAGPVRELGAGAGPVMQALIETGCPEPGQRTGETSSEP